MTAPRGIRNNNPGNIRWAKNVTSNFKGCVGKDDKGFCLFDTAENGIRAAAKVLLTYQRKHGVNTIRKAITRWAPPADNNDTAAYCRAVARNVACGIDEELEFSDPSILYRLVSAIIKHENGQQPYHGAQLVAGIASALGVKPKAVSDVA